MNDRQYVSLQRYCSTDTQAYNVTVPLAQWDTSVGAQCYCSTSAQALIPAPADITALMADMDTNHAEAEGLLVVNTKPVLALHQAWKVLQ